MRPRSLPLLLCAALAGGCDFSSLDLTAIDLGLDDDLGDNQIAAGAEDFVSCNQGRECNYLWDQARVWLDENARFAAVPRNETTLTAYSPDPDRYRAEFQYRVTLVPHPGGTAILKVEAFCADQEACEETAVEQVYKLNEYLRNHKRGLAEGVIELADHEEPELPRAAPALAPAAADDAADDGADDDELTELPLAPEYRQGRYQKQASATLEQGGCLKRSKMTLLKSVPGEELYEVECLTGVRHVVFRCAADGCEILE